MMMLDVGRSCGRLRRLGCPEKTRNADLAQSRHGKICTLYIGYSGSCAWVLCRVWSTSIVFSARWQTLKYVSYAYAHGRIVVYKCHTTSWSKCGVNQMDKHDRWKNSWAQSFVGSWISNPLKSIFQYVRMRYLSENVQEGLPRLRMSLSVLHDLSR